MGRKNKLKRFEEVSGFPNVYEVDPASGALLTNSPGVVTDLKGRWSEAHFNNSNPVVLELACGKGDYTVALAQHHPEINFIGVDIKGARIWKGAKFALQNQITNAAFLRTRIEFIEHFFGPSEIAGIWITFPDPFEGKATRRLTSPPFLDRYRKIMKPGGIIHLKTDSTLLYEYTLDVIHHDPRCKVLYSNPDIYSGPLHFPDLEHKTFYENMHLEEGRKIKYLRFSIVSSEQ